jgi:hypothetical protein
MSSTRPAPIIIALFIQESIASDVHRRMIAERNSFVSESIRSPQQYDGPPVSVEFLLVAEFKRRHGQAADHLPSKPNEVVLYNVGMNNIRSDPYTGMAMLYRYLYIAEHPSRTLVLWFPNIAMATWRAAATQGTRKDIKLFRVTADAILFSDGLLLRGDL